MYFNNNKNCETGWSRGNLHTHSEHIFTSVTSIISKPCILILILRMFPLLLPAFLCGCSKSPDGYRTATDEPDMPIIKVKGIEGEYSGGTLDILTYNNDRLCRLDSYQRIEDFHGRTVKAEHREGEKTVILLYNLKRKPFAWNEICSISTAGKLSCSLEEEDPQKPFMAGTCRLDQSGDNTAELAPLSSRICLRSISCDFSGTAYAGNTIKDLKAYITNVNAEYPMTGGNGGKPGRIINAGMLNHDDLRKFRCPEIIYREIAEELGKISMTTDAFFLCYPNTSSEDAPGSPFTRLVIEGRIGSNTYYWPININRSGNGSLTAGIESNFTYCYDIAIRRKGVTDPDTPIDPKDIDIIMTIKPWNEKENCNVSF